MHAQAGAPEPLDIVLALDNSGSMKQNDPAGLMRGAAADFVRHLPPDSRSGLVVFDKSATLALELTPVSDLDFGSRLDKALARIDYRGPLTDIPGAIERAVYEIREHGRPHSTRVVLLFTDGFVDLGDASRNRSRTEWLVSDLVPEALHERVLVFGVAFTDQADFELIQSLSQKTGGKHFRLRDASQIPDFFAQVTAQVQQARTTRTSAAAPVAIVSTAEETRSRQPFWLLLLPAFGLCVAVAWRVWYVRASSLDVPGTLQDLLDPSRVHDIRRRVFRVGSVQYKGLRRNDLVIPLGTISRAQATIHGRDGRFYLVDNGSRNHTFLDGAKLTPKTEYELRPNSVIRFDTREFRFGLAAGVAKPRQARSRTEWSAADESKSPARRIETVPPADTPGANVRRQTQPPADPRARSSAAGAPAHEQSHQETAGCLNCDRAAGAHEMTLWQGLPVCKSCETDLLEIPTSAASSRRQLLAKKLQRRLPTVPSP